jgi:transposase
MAGHKKDDVEVLGAASRRRLTAAEKLAMARETYEPGMSVSLVARKYGINPNQIFHWRKLKRIGALTAVGAGESVVHPPNSMRRVDRSGSSSTYSARRR